jgi:hypothetical protein
MPRNLKLNETITFGKNGSIKDFEPFGLDVSADVLSWTTEDMAGFAFTMEGLTPDPSLRLKLTVQPFVHEKRVTGQQFYIYINGLLVGFANLSGHQTLEFAVPRGAISPRGCRLSFVIPTAASPKSLGISADQRRLGIAVSAVSLVNQR